MTCVSAFHEYLSFMLVAYNYLNASETVRHIPKHLVAYKVFGEPGGPHYAHYDLVGGRLVCTLFFGLTYRGTM